MHSSPAAEGPSLFAIFNKWQSPLKLGSKMLKIKPEKQKNIIQPIN